MTDDEVKDLVANHSVEMRRHFDLVLERMDRRFDLVSEGLTHLDQKIDRSVSRLDDNIARTAADTQAMIKFSHAELDQRVRALEENHRSIAETVANLTARLERLESSTH